LKKTTGLEVIPENEATAAKLEVNKLYQASRDVRFKDDEKGSFIHASAANVVTATSLLKEEVG
jgi:hypothetical protein